MVKLSATHTQKLSLYDRMVAAGASAILTTIEFSSAPPHLFGIGTLKGRKSRSQQTQST